MRLKEPISEAHSPLLDTIPDRLTYLLRDHLLRHVWVHQMYMVHALTAVLQHQTPLHS